MRNQNLSPRNPSVTKPQTVTSAIMPPQKVILINTEGKSYEAFVSSFRQFINQQVPKLVHPSSDLELYTTQEVMKMLKISKNTLLRLVKAGEIKAYQIATKRQFYFTREQILGAIHPLKR